MLKTAISLWMAVSVLLSSGYNPSMTEINRTKSDIAAIEQTLAGSVTAQDIYSVEETEGGYTYINYLDGYSFTAAEEYDVDATLSNIRLHLTADGRSIDIYKESFSSPGDCVTYVSYSNRFAEDTENHYTEKRETEQINGRQTHIIQWSRDSLGEDDKNYYANVDIIDNTDVYSFMFKSDSPLKNWDYMEIIRSVALFGAGVPTAYAEPFPSGSREFTHEETRDTYNRIFIEDNPMSWGLYLHKQPLEGMSRFEDTERSLGVKMDICLFYAFVYQRYDPSLVGDCLDKAWKSGKISELTLQLPPKAESGIVYNILKGKYDGFLFDLANDVAEFGHPVLMRLFNEMNGEWCNYSGYHTSRDPDIYIRLYRYIHDIFTKCGADNVIWVWNPNEKSFPNFKWNSEEMYYPGSEYVDVVGLTGYNTGSYYEGETWRSFDRIYRNIYNKADKLYNKPMMITEFSCATTGGDKEDWVRDMFASMPDYPKLKAAVWWSSCDRDETNGNVSRSYYVDDTDGVMRLFRENLSGK
ncbi:MAG: glycoside hydrolase family 26 protein [Clostridia bacterium]